MNHVYISLARMYRNIPPKIKWTSQFLSFIVDLKIYEERKKYKFWTICDLPWTFTCTWVNKFVASDVLSCKHTKRQRQMLVYGDAWEWFWDRFSSVTIDQY